MPNYSPAASDLEILDLLLVRSAQSVSEMVEQLGVTATAVRQRLTRLMARGYVARRADKAGRGRPSHKYHLTAAGRRKIGVNLEDFAVAAWEAISKLEDGDMRRTLVDAISKQLVRRYQVEISGNSVGEKMESIAALFAQRHVPYRVEQSEGLPVLTAVACPYPDLADDDRSICSLEREMFSNLLGEEVSQGKCRLDGDGECSFQVTHVAEHQ
jgi:DeoR family suf operon transcriptional repressor